MENTRLFNIGGVNTYLNPFIKKDYEVLSCVNMDSYPLGAKTTRNGYDTFLNNSDSAEVKTLFDWSISGTTFLYKVSNGLIYYSVEGTTNWAVCGNGTISGTTGVGYTTSNLALLVGDGVGSTRHTTNGTSFTNTTLAPIGRYFTNYQGRAYVGGTANSVFYSVAADITNWSITAPNDSSSFNIGGGGVINSISNIADKVNIGKTTGEMYKWDGYALTDLSTNNAPSSTDSIGVIDGYGLYLTRQGVQGFKGQPTLLSSGIQNVFFNNSGSAIAGTVFSNAKAGTYRYNYYLSVGDFTDDIVNESVSRGIVKYDYQKNEFLYQSFANQPTAYNSFTDYNKEQQLIFGDSTGQCYKLSTSKRDNTSPINWKIVLCIHANSPEKEKEWKRVTLLFNPGADAQVSYCLNNTFLKENRDYNGLGNISGGILEKRFDTRAARSRLLFIQISGSNAATFYGLSIDYELVKD